MMKRLCLVSSFVGVLGLACSDPTPPTARAAATYRTFPTPGQNKACNSGQAAIYATEPYAPNDPTGEPDLPSLNGTPTRRGGPVYDGVEGAEVTCTVSGEGTYELSAKLEGPNQKVEGKKTNISMNATIDASGEGTGTVSFFTTDVLQVSSGQAGCTFQVVPNKGELDISPGRVWVTFNCPDVVMNSMVSGCSSQGTFVLESCRE